MNPKDMVLMYPLSGALQVSFQRDHLRKALEEIVAYAEPPNGPLEMSTEEITAAYNALKEIARRALQTVPALA